MKRTRTFVAIEASSELRAQAGKLKERLQSAFSDVKWVTTQDLHWTLQFLGDVDDLAIPEVCRAVADVSAEFEAFPIHAAGVGVFPSPDRPRIVWIGAEQGAEKMVELQTAIGERLATLGYRGEHRRFVPHLTIGRIGRAQHARNIQTSLDRETTTAFGEMTIEEVTVFASRLSTGGSQYEPLSRAPLAW